MTETREPDEGEEDAHDRDESQRPSARRDDEPPEVRDQATDGVRARRSSFLAHHHRAGRRVGDDPTERDIEIHTRTGVGRDAPPGFAEHEAVAVERRGCAGRREDMHEQPLRESRRRVAKEAVRRRVQRRRVHELRTVPVRRVEELADVRRIVLSVLVHRDDPVAAGRRHARERRGMLSEVARQPDRANPLVARRQVADDLVAAADAPVPDEEHLVDTELATILRRLGRAELLELLHQARATSRLRCRRGSQR